MTADTAWPPIPLRRDTIDVTYEDIRYRGYLVAPDTPEPRPLVLVVHNYQGLKFFDQDVAEYMARLGYVGLAIDLYGERVPEAERVFPTEVADIPGFQQRCFEAMVAMDHDPQLFRGLMQHWIDVGLAHGSVQGDIEPAMIGYCFGGVAVIEAVRGGLPLSAGVSFHGLLQTGEDPNPEKFGAIRPPLKPVKNTYNQHTVLVIENGAKDELVPLDSQQRFFSEMNEAGVDWTFHHHANTPHGFALPPTLGPPGKLYEPADRRSTVNMLAVFREVFPHVNQQSVLHNAAGTKIPG